MSKHGDGGPAFARAGCHGDGAFANDGMSVRDYFAAHAPPVPDWWPQAEWKMEFASRLIANWTSDKIDAFKGWGDWLSDEEVRPEWLAEFKTVREETRAIEARNKLAGLNAQTKRETDWRWHYADAMIAARDE